jgi:hypothetical protein
MARYSAFLGYRVEVQYRASDTLLPASGVFVADSGRSIFLEQSFEQRGQHRHFRWEIPYQYLVKIVRTQAADSESATPSEQLAADGRAEVPVPLDEPEPARSATTEKFISTAAAGAGFGSAVLPLRKRMHTA